MRLTYTLSAEWIARASMVAFAMLIGLGWVAQDASARRLDGGGSFGRQSPNVPRQATPPSRDTTGQAAQRPTQPPGVQPQPAGNRWLGPIAGLAAGLGIAALLSHFGMGGAFGDALGSMLLIALLVFAGVFLWRMLRGTRSAAPADPRMQPAYGVGDAGSANAGNAPASAYTPLAGSSMPGSVASLSSSAAAPSPATQWGVPDDFDVAAFLRNAKVYFIRLQAAWDSKNLVDIREFTTPEVFAEIRMQIEEDKGAKNQTDVVTLDAALLGIETTPTDYLASARFTGTIRENGSSTAEPFEEVWNLSKPREGQGGWLLAGIQQVH